MSNWQKNFQQEIELAEDARANQNEGRARVCARRAAGIVIRAYFKQRGLPSRAASAIDWLTALRERADAPAAARQAAEKVLLRVNADFQLPAEIDLVQEARVLAEELLPFASENLNKTEI